MPDEPEVLGLLALMLLIDARRAARTTRRRRARPAGRPGPRALGRREDRGGPGARPPAAAPRPARPVPAPGGDQRRPQRPADRLAADRRALRPAAGLHADAGRRAQPRGRARRGRRARGPRWSSSTTSSSSGYHRFHAIRADLLRRLEPRRRGRARPTRRRSRAPRTPPSATSSPRGSVTDSSRPRHGRATPRAAATERLPRMDKPGGGQPGRGSSSCPGGSS